MGSVYAILLSKLFLRPDLAEDRTHAPRGTKPTCWYLSHSDSHWPDRKFCPTIETLAARPLASGNTTPSIPFSWINMWINTHAQQLSPVLLRHLAPLISDTRDMRQVSSVLWCHWLITPLSPVIGQCIASHGQSGCTADQAKLKFKGT